MKWIYSLSLILLSSFLIGQCDVLDTSFDSDGILAINVGNQSGTTDMEVATFITDSLIIVVGNIKVNSIEQGGVAFFNLEGDYINKIKIGTSQFSSNDYILQTACLQHDGKLLVAGHVGSFFGKGPVFIARVNLDGTMDSSFGNAGIVLHYLGETDLNYMSQIKQEPTGSILVRGRGKEHDDELNAIQVTCNSSGSSTNHTVFSFSDFSTYSFYEFINGSVFSVKNLSNEITISFFSGNPFPLGANDEIVLDNSEIDSRITGLKILSNDKLAAFGYALQDDIKYPIVFLFNEDGTLDTSFFDKGYKILDQSNFETADIILYGDLYYITTRHYWTGASIHKLNFDGTAVHNAWGNPSRSAYPIIRGAKVMVKDSALFIAGEVNYDGQSDFGLVKYIPCDYNQTVLEDYPFKTIGELKEIDNEGLPVLDGKFTTRGVVSSINFSSDRSAFMSIMDEENEGIFISGDTTAFEYIPKLGEEILISGNLQSHFESTAEIFWRYYKIESVNNTITTPIEVSELNTYSEGVYVNLKNVTIVNENQWKGDGSTFSVRASDGINTFDIKIHATSYWADKSVPQGVLTVSGIGGQDDLTIPYLSDFEIYPQFQSDIVATSKTNESMANLISIYPNPSSSNLTIDIGDMHFENVSVYDCLGKERVVQLKDNVLDVSSLESGIYILTVKNHTGRIVDTTQFIKI